MIRLPFSKEQKLVVFSDLDGTLIDHHTYTIQDSEAALRILVDEAIPLVFCSSKTFAEQVYLQRQFGILQPFIFENGSAAAIPVGFFSTKMYSPDRFEEGYEIVVFAHADSIQLNTCLLQIEGIKGYQQASDAELSTATGLSGTALGRARERWFTETLLSSLDEQGLKEVKNFLLPLGYTLSQGGRFFTVQSAQVNKGKAVVWMMEQFRKAFGRHTCFAAIGDSPNDVPMLEVVDIPFLVQKPDQTWAKVDLPHLIHLKAVGPKGFSAAIRLLT